MEQHLNEKGSWFCGVTRDENDMFNLIKNINEANFYAYIIHDNDNTSDHIHYILNVAGSRAIKSIGKMLDVNPQYIQVCNQVKGYARYLLHKDDPDKFQYKIENVFTSDLDRYLGYVNDKTNNVCELFDDYQKVVYGRLSSLEFIEKYRSEFSKMNFYQKIKVFDSLRDSFKKGGKM